MNIKTLLSKNIYSLSFSFVSLPRCHLCITLFFIMLLELFLRSYIKNNDLLQAFPLAIFRLQSCAHIYVPQSNHVDYESFNFLCPIAYETEQVECISETANSLQMVKILKTNGSPWYRNSNKFC